MVPFTDEDDGEEPEPWIVEGLIREGGLTIVVGTSNVGKTVVTAMLIAVLASGRLSHIGGEDGAGVPVAWINAEETTSSLRLMLRAAFSVLRVPFEAGVLLCGCDQSPDGLILALMEREYGKAEIVPNEPLLFDLCTTMQQAGTQVIFADPLTELTDGNENDRLDVRKTLRIVKDLAEAVGAALVLMAHTGKPGDSDAPDSYRDDLYAVRGSSQATGTAQVVATLSPVIPSTLPGEGPGTVQKRGVREAKAYYRRMRDPTDEAPNIVELTIVKAKEAAERPHLYFHIRPSGKFRTIPVAGLVGASDVSTSHDAAKMSPAPEAQKVLNYLVRMLGDGEHDQSAVRRVMMTAAAQRTTGVKWPQIDNTRRVIIRQLVEMRKLVPAKCGRLEAVVEVQTQRRFTVLVTSREA